MTSQEAHFDQMTVNRYEPGEGICAHVDLLRFAGHVAILSLGSPAVMTFILGSSARDVLLEPGDLLLLEGEARCPRTDAYTALAGLQGQQQGQMSSDRASMGCAGTTGSMALQQ